MTKILNNLTSTPLVCHNCQQTFYFRTYNCQQWKYYYTKEGKIRPSSDFYQLYCQPPFPNFEENIVIHCRHCLTFFNHKALTDEEGRIRGGCQNGAIYIDSKGLCWECRNQEKHEEHPCQLNKSQRVWGTTDAWEGLFATSQLTEQDIRFRKE